MYRRNPRSGHTPGPWEITRQDYGEPRDASKIKIYGLDMLLATLPSDRSAEDGQIVHEANARLIAAAPDLLGVLKEAEEIIFGPIADLITGDQMAETGAYDVLDTIRKAIAKAEGRR
jgi:hypothetical protein